MSLCIEKYTFVLWTAHLDEGRCEIALERFNRETADLLVSLDDSKGLLYCH
jgi:hypothetical protein